MISERGIGGRDGLVLVTACFERVHDGARVRAGAEESDAIRTICNVLNRSTCAPAGSNGAHTDIGDCAGGMRLRAIWVCVQIIHFVCDGQRAGTICWNTLIKMSEEQVVLREENGGETASRSSVYIYIDSTARKRQFGCFLRHVGGT